jgi:hypothetical protein
METPERVARRGGSSGLPDLRSLILALPVLLVTASCSPSSPAVSATCNPGVYASRSQIAITVSSSSPTMQIDSVAQVFYDASGNETGSDGSVLVNKGDHPGQTLTVHSSYTPVGSASCKVVGFNDYPANS